MATFSMTSALIYTNAIIPNDRRRSFVCESMAKTTPEHVSADLRRRSGNYRPSSWDHRSLLSIENKYWEQEVIIRDLLKKKVRTMLDVETKSRLEQLQLVDDLQKLGVSYHFEKEINNILKDFYENNGRNNEEDLHFIALKFRLLRQHGFDVSEDIFDVIVDKIESDTFETDDVRSIITLHEASYLSTTSDTKLRKIIKPFATDQLRKFVDSCHNDDTTEVCEMAMHSLEMPYHWRMRRLETRWYIDTYEKKHDMMNHLLLEFAKLDFNIAQISHQEDLKFMSRWWKETCLGEQLPFVRDRIVENYFWTVGSNFEPQYGKIRRIMTKVNALITTIDDIYDIYGTIEELELFTSIVDKWDINRVDELPEYMRLCFLVLYNEINGIGCDILKDKNINVKNINVIHFLKKSWADLCKTYLVEAKWYKRGYKPNVEEYMQNAWISVSAPTILVHFYCVFSDQISIEFLESLTQHRQQLARCSATVLRLANDLGTSADELARGDVLKSVQCYMHETGASEKEARAHIQHVISDTWEEMNYEIKTARSSSFYSQGFVEAALNLARMSQCMYQFGDGHGCPDKAKTNDRVQSLLLNPIPLH